MIDTVPVAMQTHKNTTSTGHSRQAPSTALQSLVYRISQLAHETEGPLTLAFTGLEAGSPSRQLAQRIAFELAQHPEHRVLYADLGTLINAANSGTPLADHIAPTTQPGLCQIALAGLSGVQSPDDRWRSDAAFRQRYLAGLGEGFSYILLGCKALDESPDVLGVASLLDGFVLTVEAERTRKADLLRAEHVILNAGGRLLGSVLNNTTKPAPGWAVGK